jgi:hypothetical protein
MRQGVRWRSARDKCTRDGIRKSDGRWPSDLIRCWNNDNDWVTMRWRSPTIRLKEKQ